MNIFELTVILILFSTRIDCHHLPCSCSDYQNVSLGDESCNSVEEIRRC